MKFTESSFYTTSHNSGLPYLFQPDGLKGLIDACTDIETDAAENELNTPSPWPPQIREQVWADRVRLRLKMKQEMKTYRIFFEKYSIEDIRSFCVSGKNSPILKRIFQMPRQLILDAIKEYGIHSSYSNVLSAVIDQVANFHLTKYKPDGRSIDELQFERNLIFSKRGAGFTLPLFTVAYPDQVNQDALDVFLKFMTKLGGPKLLMRKLERSNDDDSEEDDENDEKGSSNKNGPSFQGDRRLIRLIIARFWTRSIIEKFESSKSKDDDIDEVTNGIESVL